jgi:hypothetical protein
MRMTSIAGLVAVGLLLAGAPGVRSSDKDPESTITHAVAALMDHSSDSKAALVEILEASLLVLPKTDYAGAYKARIASATKDFRTSSIFNETARADLVAARSLVTAGQEWKFPLASIRPRDDEKGIERATVYCQAEIDSALVELRTGHRECAVRHLLDFVLMVITPIER